MHHMGLNCTYLCSRETSYQCGADILEENELNFRIRKSFSKQNKSFPYALKDLVLPVK